MRDYKKQTLNKDFFSSASWYSVSHTFIYSQFIFLGLDSAKNDT